MLSLAQQDLARRRPVPVVRWTRQMAREIEAARDRIMAMCASPMPVIEAESDELASLGEHRVTIQWRKPLSIEEVAQMAPTPEVRERKGRP